MSAPRLADVLDSADVIHDREALDDAQDVVRLRGWVDQGEHFSVGRHALVPVRHLAQTQRNTRRERAQPSG